MLRPSMSQKKPAESEIRPSTLRPSMSQNKPVKSDLTKPEQTSSQLSESSSASASSVPVSNSKDIAVVKTEPNSENVEPNQVSPKLKEEKPKVETSKSKELTSEEEKKRESDKCMGLTTGSK